ncbi:jg22772 [Pararge aegeria aegeria]|uniref:Jg22772 protein n=1 Tax=Pararge aegeria aegeria TaxID=348720 RepID=A0A8S4QKW6_9NEOP|nr:jg22772 [Pararge aegeria aegeria]
MDVGVLRCWNGRRKVLVSAALVDPQRGGQTTLSASQVTPRCHHCGGDQDTAQHTLEDCPAWESERRVLINNVGGDLSPPAVIAAMLAKDRAWKAAASFCETVMLKKEAAERDLERANPARRRKRRGHDSN